MIHPCYGRDLRKSVKHSGGILRRRRNQMRLVYWKVGRVQTDWHVAIGVVFCRLLTRKIVCHS